MKQARYRTDLVDASYMRYGEEGKFIETESRIEVPKGWWEGKWGW